MNRRSRQVPQTHPYATHQRLVLSFRLPWCPPTRPCTTPIPRSVSPLCSRVISCLFSRYPSLNLHQELYFFSFPTPCLFRVRLCIPQTTCRIQCFCSATSQFSRSHSPCPCPVGKMEPLLEKRRVEKLVDPLFHNTLRIVKYSAPRQCLTLHF